MNTGEKRMRRLSAIAPPKGKLGVLTVGMGAVATTFMAGVDLVRRKKAQPVGSLTQMGTIRLGKRTDGRTPSIQEFVPLEKLENFVFGGWDIFPDTAYEAAKNAAVLGPDHLAEVKKFLSKIRPMKAAFDQNYVKKLTGTHVKKARTKYDLALQIKDDIKNFQKKTRVSRTVVIWCGSTEIFLKPHAVYATPETFVAAMKANHAAIAPSMLYAWAAITSGIPFANGAPNLTVDVPALTELARQHGVPICGKDFKTGQTLMKTILAPGFKARLLGMNGWFSTNILGNRDGEVLDDPNHSRRRKSRSSVCSNIFSSRNSTQIFTARFIIRCGSIIIRRAGTTRKAGTISTSSGGWAIRCRSRWISCAATRSWQLRSYWIWFCFWTWPSAPDARDSGMAELLLQVADVRAGALPGA